MTREGEAKPGRKPFAGSLPAPNFKLFVSSMAGQALIQLGTVEDPAGGGGKRDLDQAKYTIDLLQILCDKTRGNLDAEEQALLDGILYELRMRYVEAMTWPAARPADGSSSDRTAGGV